MNWQIGDVRVREVASDAFAALPPIAAVRSPSLEQLQLTAPDCCLVAFGSCDEPVGRAAAWWTDPPVLEGNAVGRIGHFAAESQAATHAVLGAARDRCREHGIGHLVGPLDGTTWFSYRFVDPPSEGTASSLPPFALEPSQPAEWPSWWRSAGFTTVASYHSDFVATLPRLSANAVHRYELEHGVVLRSLDLADWTNELDRIFRVAAVAFANAFLATSITCDQFHALYAPVRPMLDPHLVLLAERNGETIGFGLGIPDALQRARGVPVDTAIIKTVAVHPERRSPGLGGLIVAALHDRAASRGYRHAIHALIHDANVASSRVSARAATAMRRYALLGLRLSP
jgi:GNAT superfamily N-acetyltransferase